MRIWKRKDRRQVERDYLKHDVQNLFWRVKQLENADRRKEEEAKKQREIEAFIAAHEGIRADVV